MGRGGTAGRTAGGTACGTARRRPKEVWGGNKGTANYFPPASVQPLLRGPPLSRVGTGPHPVSEGVKDGRVGGDGGRAGGRGGGTSRRIVWGPQLVAISSRIC